MFTGAKDLTRAERGLQSAERESSIILLQAAIGTKRHYLQAILAALVPEWAVRNPAIVHHGARNPSFTSLYAWAISSRSSSSEPAKPGNRDCKPSVRAH